jgi:predicted ATPase
LNRLPDLTQEAIGLLACLGNVAEIATLSLLQEESEQEIHAALWEAVRAELVLRLDSSYAFLHDRVQEAAYALIPESERAVVHLRIGRLFVSRTAPEEIEEKIFEIVNQLNRGTLLIDSLEERERVAELKLIAAKRARTSTAYVSARTYLVEGLALLAEDSWEHQYALTFARVPAGRVRVYDRRLWVGGRTPLDVVAPRRQPVDRMPPSPACKRNSTQAWIKATRCRGGSRVPSARWRRLVPAPDERPAKEGI